MKKICLLLVLCLLVSVCAAFAETPEDVSDLLAQAQAALAAEDYETAVPLLRTAADAGNDQAQLWLGNCYDAGAGGLNRAPKKRRSITGFPRTREISWQCIILRFATWRETVLGRMPKKPKNC